VGFELVRQVNENRLFAMKSREEEIGALPQGASDRPYTLLEYIPRHGRDRVGELLRAYSDVVRIRLAIVAETGCDSATYVNLCSPIEGAMLELCGDA